MKIGILTFHRAENFGAVLQCFALQTYLEAIGNDVKIIDYRCKAIEQVYYLLYPKSLLNRLNLFASIYNYLIRLSSYRDRYEKKRGYIDFRNKYLHQTKSMHKIDEDLGFDVYITGSDQVWNPALLHGYDKTYFLDFPVSPGSKRISYAVSSDQSGINVLNKFENELRPSLQQIDYISVREENLANALAKYTSKKIQICIDPTFLISREQYLKMAIRPCEKKYILVYHMAEIPEGSKCADLLAKKNKWIVIEVHANFARRKDNDRHRQNVGPLELLGYIAYAEYIITSSFHGLAFSLIMHKNFCTVSNKKNVRLANLLNFVGLNDRMIESAINIPESDIDYNSVDEKISEYVSQSKNFLSKALKQ